jgi:O-antigen/teichoic acid export membrane protein
MGLAFIPVYIKYLGIEAYGLIGLFAVLQAWLSLLDVGMTPTLGREMARFTGGATTAQQLRDLLRSIEALTLALVAAVALAAVISSNWIATNWLNPENLSSEVVAQAFAIMGLAVALKFAEGIYRSSLVGLQKQVLFNAFNASIATVRAVGAVVVLIYISPTIKAFFLWQAAVSVAAVAVLALATYQVIPRTHARARFSISALRQVWRFAAGMVGITFLALLLTQVDKILLSKLLNLEQFGVYALAASVASGLFALVSPITQAFYPRFCEFVASKDSAALSRSYHNAAQLVSVVAGSLAIVLIVYPEIVLELWTQDSHVAAQAAPLLSLLMSGNLLNCMMWVPYQAQLAYGWTGLAIRINLSAVIVVIPAILLAVPKFGAIGAAYVWVCLNVVYIAIGPALMFRKILAKEQKPWFLHDFLAPILASATAVLLLRLIWSSASTNIEKLMLLATAFILGIGAACAVSDNMRTKMALLRYKNLFFPAITEK